MVLDIPKIYNPPNKQDICVGLSFFSPYDYVTPKMNLNIVIEQLKQSKIPFFTIELLYPNQKNSITSPTITVYGNSVLFSKENLWNILETKIPKEYSKIIFMDADIKFSDPDWINKASTALDYHDTIQPMEYIFRDIYHNDILMNPDQGHTHKVIAKTIADNLIDNHHPNKNQWFGHPGHAIGIRRDFFHKIGGLFEYGINGFGDAMYWGYFHTVNLMGINFGSKLYPDYHKIRKQIYAMKTDSTVGYLKDIYCLHLYHGETKNRKYGNRNHYVPENFQLYKNKYGVLEIFGEHDLKQYWIDRREDD
jgi:hypothetical protein